MLRGEGGSLRDLDAPSGKGPETIGLTYGYVEAEVTLSSSFARVGRPILGLRENGITGGAAGFLRVGNDLRTNLLVGGEVLGGGGQRGIVELAWRTIPRVPIVLRTEVTTQPASASDVGARAIAQIGYQLVRDRPRRPRGRPRNGLPMVKALVSLLVLALLGSAATAHADPAPAPALAETAAPALHHAPIVTAPLAQQISVDALVDRPDRLKRALLVFRGGGTHGEVEFERSSQGTPRGDLAYSTARAIAARPRCSRVSRVSRGGAR